MRQKTSRQKNKSNIPNKFKTYTTKSDRDTFTVLSYNILAYHYTNIEYYPYCESEYLLPKYRAPRIIEEIASLDPDIVCLQEMDNDLFLDFYKTNLESLGYNCYMKPTKNLKIVGNLMAYKHNKYSLINLEFICLNKALEGLDQSFSKNKEAIIITIKNRTTGKQIVAVNTHLYWDPKFEYIKYGQIAVILTHLDKIYGKSANIVVCGDFNSLPNSNVLNYVYKIKPDYTNCLGDIVLNRHFMEQFWAESKHSLDLRSAYDIYKLKEDSFSDLTTNIASHPDFTVYVQDFNGNLDYILYNRDRLQVVALLEIPTDNPEIKSKKLPNKIYPSDHLKIAVKFSFK